MSASFAGGLHARSCFAQLNAQHTGHNRSHAAAEQSGLYFVQGWLLQPMQASGREMVPRPYKQGRAEQDCESPCQNNHHPSVVLKPALVISAFDFFQLCPPLVFLGRVAAPHPKQPRPAQRRGRNRIALIRRGLFRRQALWRHARATPDSAGQSNGSGWASPRSRCGKPASTACQPDA